MEIVLTPKQFQDLNEITEASRRAMASTEEGELTLPITGVMDGIEWSTEQVKITLSD